MMTAMKWGFLGLWLVGGAAVAADYQLDTTASQIKWVGKKVTGQHDGTLNLKSGTVSLDDKNVPTAVTAVLDMNTITDKDITDAENKAKLEKHLKSDDFFGVGKYPEGKFVLKTAKAGAEAGTVDITGALTVKNKTNDVTFPAKITVEGTKATATASLKIDRTKWDIKYNSGKFFDLKKLGDKAINDELELELNLVGNVKETPVAKGKGKKADKAAAAATPKKGKVVGTQNDKTKAKATK